MKLQKIKITMRRGATNAVPIRVESGEWSYAPISSIEESAPMRITAPDHGIPDGWRAAVMNAKGLTDLNAANNPPKDAELRRITRIDANTVEINAINAAGMRAHVANTGQLAFYTPLNLSGYTSARMNVKKSISGEALATLTTTDGTLEIDAANYAVWLRPTIAQTLLIASGEYLFDVELLTDSGTVTPICTAESVLNLTHETTTTE